MKYRPELDGIRGCAIVLVLAAHFLAWGPGARGVDLFFVLSGFLITTLLLEEHARTGTVSLSNFYRRRSRRLFPALAVLLIVYAVVEINRGNDPLGSIAAYGLYGANVFTAYHAHGHHSLALAHLWSLAEEEQFYLVWPLALLAVIRFRRPATVIAMIAAGLIVYRGWAVVSGADWWHIYYPPQMRADGLLIGCIAAFTARRRGGIRSTAVPPIALFLMVATVFFARGDTIDFLLNVPIFEVAAAAFILAAIAQVDLAKIVGVAPLAWVGRISYSLYLWHVLLLWLFNHQMRGLVFVLSFVVATASYVLIEQPFRQRRVTAVIADLVRRERPGRAAFEQ